MAKAAKPDRGLDRKVFLFRAEPGTHVELSVPMWTPAGEIIEVTGGADRLEITINADTSWTREMVIESIEVGTGLKRRPADEVVAVELPAIPEEEIEEWPAPIDYDITPARRDVLLAESDRIVRGLAVLNRMAVTEIEFVGANIRRLVARRDELSMTWAKRITEAKTRLEERHRALSALKSVSKTWDTGYGKALLREPDPRKPVAYKVEYDHGESGEVELLQWALEADSELLKWGLNKRMVQTKAKRDWVVAEVDGVLRYTIPAEVDETTGEVTAPLVVLPGVIAVAKPGSWSFAFGDEQQEGEPDED